MEWDPALCEGVPPERTFLCSELESYALLFVRELKHYSAYTLARLEQI